MAGSWKVKVVWSEAVSGGAGHVIMDGDRIHRVALHREQPALLRGAYLLAIEGDGTLEIINGGLLRATAAAGFVNGIIGYGASGTGHVRVTGEGSLWDANGPDFGQVRVGVAGDGTLEITAGGKVINTAGVIGFAVGGTGHVIVDGVGSQWLTNYTPSGDQGHLAVGSQGAGTLHITNGASVILDGHGVIGRIGGRDGHGNRFEHRPWHGLDLADRRAAWNRRRSYPIP